MKIHTYGVDTRLEFCREYLNNHPLHSVKSIALLPIPTSKDGKNLNGTDEPLDSLSEKLGDCDVIVGYDISKELRASFLSYGATVLDVSRDEDFLLENADLTAVGTVGRILAEQKAVPRELSFGIIGYGRIGERLLHFLMFLSGRVTVFTSKSDLRQELCMLGVSGVDSLSLDSPDAQKKLSELDILINTAPAKLITEDMCDALSGVKIIELASGDNLPRCLDVSRLASVPARMYPKSAGAALARSVLRMLGEPCD